MPLKQEIKKRIMTFDEQFDEAEVIHEKPRKKGGKKGKKAK